MKPPPRPRLACIRLRECKTCRDDCNRYEIRKEDEWIERHIEEEWRKRVDAALNPGCKGCGG